MATQRIPEEMVKRLEELHQKATHAPWSAGDGCGLVFCEKRTEDNARVAVAYTGGIFSPTAGYDEEARHANAMLTAEMRNALPSLLAERTALLERIAELVEGLKPFAKHSALEEYQHYSDKSGHMVELGHLRHAKALIEKEA